MLGHGLGLKANIFGLGLEAYGLGLAARGLSLMPPKALALFYLTLAEYLVALLTSLALVR